MTPPAKSASGGKSGSPKNKAKKPAAEGKKKAAPKKRTPRKKKNGSAFPKLLLAFAAGIVLASLGIWMVGGFSLPNLRDIVERDSPIVSAEARHTKPALPKAAPAVSGAKPALPKVHEQSALSSQDEEGGRASAVESALMDLQSLAYEENPAHASLEERVRQADYALMQAGWLQKLPARAMRLAASEERASGGQAYRFQRIDILPGLQAASFVDALKDCLALWGEWPSLKATGKDTWAISMDGLQTHSIRLYPGLTDFPAASGGVPLSRPAETETLRPETAMPRLRAGGEEPKLVIVIDDMGASDAAMRQLLALDYPVTCAFWPHGAHTRSGARAAYAAGREILVHQPMEPLGYPKVKPGPNVLLNGMSEDQIRRIVENSIAAVPHAAGLNNHMGSRFTQQADGVGAVIRVLKERGLFMLDSLTHKNSVFAAQGKRMGIEHYSRNVFLDAAHSRAAILAELRRAERIALFTGQAVAIGHPLPETLATLRDWQRLRNREVRIVKLSDLDQNP